MFNPYILDSDVARHHEKVRMDYVAAQRPVSLRGLREIVGHTFIRVGTSIQGRAREACEECAETGRSLTNPNPIPVRH